MPVSVRQSQRNWRTPGPNAFDDGGSKFPIDFNDSVWRFLNYSTKGNPLQKLKRCFLEEEDFKTVKGRVMRDHKTGQVTGKESDKYFMSQPLE